MTKYRSIRTSIINSRKVAMLTWEEEAWWHRLLLIPDDMGGLELDEDGLKVRALGRRAGEVAADRWAAFLERCAGIGLLEVYETDPPDGKRYARILNYGQNMRYGKNAEVPLSPDLSEEELQSMARSKNNPSFKAFMSVVLENAPEGLAMTKQKEKRIRAVFDEHRKEEGWAARWRTIAAEVGKVANDL